ncbi:NlpC/P60 family protein [Clostridium sp. WILCCON 0269]|uniref:NlpC/P60 family protein n=1 Tax=Candidatus Clostridium eludens TaxID=3381663 RepID=A0ABW8SPB7_9CLOT
MSIFKYIKLSISIFFIFILMTFIFISTQSTSMNIRKNNTTINIPTFNLNDNAVNYNKNDISTCTINRKEVLNKAYEMANVSWIPKYNLFDKYSHYTFIKGKTYYGIPYSMSYYQATSINDFLSKISNSNVIYGNDCAGFVSICWGINRQTTLSLFNAVKYHTKIDGKTVNEISWQDLKPGDALLLDNGGGKGHIMIYIDTNPKNGNELNVYEQNVQTVTPFVSVPTARKDVRFKSNLINSGYIPIRLMTLT